ncbi:MAG: DUF2062 domain-containing protein [Alphaproteobacteria bacterium]
MFGRRRPLSAHHRVWSVVWPKAGWRRASRYIAHRVRRLPGTPYRIAAGFASGAAVSFTPFIGLHFVFAALLALLLRGSVVASAIGTAVGNLWTFPFIWAWIYSVGLWLMGAEAASDLPATLSLGYIFERPLDVLMPMTLGGLPTAVVVWIGFFWPVRGAVAEYQHARRRRMRRKVRDRLARREAMARTQRIRTAAAADPEQEEA